MTDNKLLKRLAALDDPAAVIDEMQRRDFISFLMGAFPHLNGGANLMPNWHLDAIAYQLDRIVSEQSRRLLVSLPPRNLKSVMISVAWVAWRLGHDPRLNFVCVSYSDVLSAKHARDCRALMQSSSYKRLFPRTVLRRSRTAASDFETTSGGGRLATSVGGTLTGRGGDIIIIDDPIKPLDAKSDAVRNGVNEWYRSTLASRLNDKERGAIIAVMQRVHQDDLAGMLLEKGKWTELALPAIAYEDSTIPLTLGRVHHRHVNDVLHPERESYDTLMAQKLDMGTADFEAQYQQRPLSPKGKIIQAEWIKTCDANTIESGGQIVQSYDTANKDGLFNDWSVGITARVIGKTVYILNVWRKKVLIHDLVKAVIEQAQTYGADVLLVEDQASGQQLLQHLRNEQPRGVPAPISRRPEADKVTRLAGVAPMIEAGQLFLPAEALWLGEFKQELLGFPSTKHADQVDALSQLLGWVRSHDQSSGVIGWAEFYTVNEFGMICDGDGNECPDFGENDPNDCFF